MVLIVTCKNGTALPVELPDTVTADEVGSAIAEIMEQMKKGGKLEYDNPPHHVNVPIKDIKALTIVFNG